MKRALACTLAFLLTFTTVLPASASAVGAHAETPAETVAVMQEKDGVDSMENSSGTSGVSEAGGSESGRNNESSGEAGNAAENGCRSPHSGHLRQKNGDGSKRPRRSSGRKRRFSFRRNKPPFSNGKNHAILFLSLIR